MISDTNRASKGGSYNIGPIRLLIQPWRLTFDPPVDPSINIVWRNLFALLLEF